jgi:SCY1-like protein 1
MIFVATERVTPLSWDTKRNVLNNDILRWGLYSVSRTIVFINESATSVHGNVRLSSIFTSEAGEWKLSGLEVLTNLKEDENAIFVPSQTFVGKLTLGGVDLWGVVA